MRRTFHFYDVNIVITWITLCHYSGLHHKKTDCKIDATVQKFQTIIEKNTNSLFPPSVNIQEGEHNLASKFSPNGGWGDTRDHALCFQLMQKRWCTIKYPSDFWVMQIHTLGGGKFKVFCLIAEWSTSSLLFHGSKPVLWMYKS